MNNDTIIVTDSKQQNKGRGLMIGGVLAIIAGMYLIDKSSQNYTACCEEDQATFRELHEALERGAK